MKSNNCGPQNPRNFLEELQRNTLEAVERVSSEQDDSTQQATSAPAPVPGQDANVALAIASFSTKVMREVYNLMCERDEAQLRSKALGNENRQMSLRIEALNETIAARDAKIEELTANIERLTKEKAKLQTA